MKKIIYLLFCLVLFSCNDTFKESGEIEVLNGSDVKTIISYQIGNFEELQKMITKSEFESIVQKSAIETKRNCKYELTFEPKSISMFSDGDTITTIFRCNAKNAFGVPDEITGYSKFKRATFIRSF